jgi:release factor H-coupled RctB family protein
VIYPHLIGGDIGCGMALFQTNLPARGADVDAWVEQYFHLEHPWDTEPDGFLAEHELESTAFDKALGTIGGGNHFAELQMVEAIFNSREFRLSGIGRDCLLMLIHSGSRELGDSVLRDYRSRNFGDGVEADSFAARKYLRGHDHALRWAKANRELVALRFAKKLSAKTKRLWDGCHNSITRCGDGWLHRRGAVAAEKNFVVIPGSRGSLSYVVRPKGDGQINAWSLAHGAGRKWLRSEARLRMRERFSVDELVQTRLGCRVICGERDLLYEEAPEAYKNIEDVVADLVAAGLVSVIATLRPLLTYKTRKNTR